MNQTFKLDIEDKECKTCTKCMFYFVYLRYLHMQRKMILSFTIRTIKYLNNTKGEENEV